jgi:transcriptional regulator with XRE-family HTH domain
MKAKQLRAIRDRMKLTQAELAARLKITPSSVARMEQGVMIVTPPMELLITYVAKEMGVERDRKRPAHTSGHEVQGLGHSGDVRVHRRKQQDAKKSSRRRGSEKA